MSKKRTTGRGVVGSLVGAMAGSVQRYVDPFEPVPAAWTLDAPDHER
jgi:hypothetical protein